MLVALLHVWFFVLESLLWTTPVAAEAFGATPGELEPTRVLAANQGVYNLILAAGLIWGLRAAEPERGRRLNFFLVAVLAAGLFGGLTAFPSILVIQAPPAAVALWAVRREARRGAEQLEGTPSLAGGSGTSMPFGAALDPDDIAQIADCIDGGAR